MCFVLCGNCKYKNKSVRLSNELAISSRLCIKKSRLRAQSGIRARLALCVCAIPSSVILNRSTKQFYFNFFYISETTRSFLFRRRIARVLASCYKAAKNEAHITEHRGDELIFGLRVDELRDFYNQLWPRVVIFIYYGLWMLDAKNARSTWFWIVNGRN
jgi:hypothetical protein